MCDGLKLSDRFCYECAKFIDPDTGGADFECFTPSIGDLESKKGCWHEGYCCAKSEGDCYESNVGAVVGVSIAAIVGFFGAHWSPVTANEEGERIAHIVESTVINLVSGEEAFVGDDFVLDPKTNVTSTDVVVDEVNLVFNEKDFYEDQEFRHSPSKFLVAGAAAPRNTDAISVETAQSTIVITNNVPYK
eukprot:gene18440-22003_t